MKCTIICNVNTVVWYKFAIVAEKYTDSVFQIEGNNPCQQTLLVAYLLGLLFDLGDEGSMFLRNTSKLLLDCMA
jgi:hypothetical protein